MPQGVSAQTDEMNQSRDLRETVVRALAKVGLVWVLAVLGALFMAMSSQGLEPGGGLSFGTPDSVRSASSFSVDAGTAPRTAGLALVLFVLAGGVTVLAVGGAREQRGPKRAFEPEPDFAMDLPLALGLCFAGPIAA
jgi:hypothetical protein